MRACHWSKWLCASSLAMACSSPSDTDPVGTGIPGTDSGDVEDEDEDEGDDTNSSASTTGTPTPDDSGDPDDDGSVEPMYDLGGIPDVPGQEEMGCLGIDFLFVIDNSGSMGAQQTQLLASFDGFIEGIENSLQDVDSFHVGVVTSDDYTYNEPGCTTLGDLVTYTQAHGQCTPFEEGNRFLTEQDDIQATFPCIGEVGTYGSGAEMPVSAAINAVSEEKAAPGACNEGFLRDDSILVLVIVTDDPPVAGYPDDAEPSLDISGWAPAILAAKNDNPEALVVIGFIPWNDISCVPLSQESPNLIDFVDAFGEQGVKASVCEPDYGPIFTETIDTIKTTCDNFNPAG